MYINIPLKASQVLHEPGECNGSPYVSSSRPPSVACSVGHDLSPFADHRACHSTHRDASPPTHQDSSWDPFSSFHLDFEWGASFSIHGALLPQPTVNSLSLRSTDLLFSQDLPKDKFRQSLRKISQLPSSLWSWNFAPKKRQSCGKAWVLDSSKSQAAGCMLTCTASLTSAYWGYWKRWV